MPKWIEITRDELEALLAKTRVGVEQPEDWKMGPTAMLSRPDDLADMIASHAAALRDDHREVVDAHICCEHAGTGDGELLAMAALMPALPMVSKLGFDARERVMKWARRRACDGLPPF